DERGDPGCDEVVTPLGVTCNPQRWFGSHEVPLPGAESGANPPRSTEGHTMVRRLLGSAAAAVLVLGLSAGGAFAGGGNPAGTGQPGAECGDEGATLMPHGFTTGGFPNPEGA